MVPHPPRREAVRVAELRRSFLSRAGDVFVCTYPKCGTTWMQQIVLLLLHGGDATKVKPRPAPSRRRPGPRSATCARSASAALPLPRRAHAAAAPRRGLRARAGRGRASRRTRARGPLPAADANLDPKAKIVYIARNPKDVCCSLYAHASALPPFEYAGDFDHFAGNFVEGKVEHGSWKDHHVDWYVHAQRDERVYYVHFEALKADPRAEIAKLALRSSSTCRVRATCRRRSSRAAAGSDFKAMKAAAAKAGDGSAEATSRFRPAARASGVSRGGKMTDAHSKAIDDTLLAGPPAGPRLPVHHQPARLADAQSGPALGVVMRRPMAPLALALSLVVAAFVALRLRATPAAVVSFRSTGRASDDDADDAPAINDGGTKLPPDAPSLADVSDEEDARFAAFRASRGRAYGDDEAAAPLAARRAAPPCWAFSVAQQVQSEWYLDGNPASEFSAQQIISCDDEMFGCGARRGSASRRRCTSRSASRRASRICGITPTSRVWAASGRASRPSARRRAGASARRSRRRCSRAHAQVANYSWATKGCFDDCEDQDLYGLRKAVAAHGPASICVNAGELGRRGRVMSTATRGSYNFNDLDHCVGLVGFNMDSDPPYWIVKNQWSTTWGADGRTSRRQNEQPRAPPEATFAKVFPPDGAYRPHDGARVTTPV
ncbi:C1 peptidase family protein [Aureococcus anophagefferens]|uniref:C1 peptidase family protein n=1 Tax=Aureococcus anophagefferens TaxID=44056 RepID=A0ABR1FG16_AURAN